MKFKNIPKPIWASAIALIVLVIAGVFLWHYYSVRESTDDAQVDGHITPISARVGGTVTSINFQDNQKVEAGAILVQLDPKDYQVAVAKAKAELADAQAEEAAARTSVPITHTSTVTGIDAARATLVAAQREVEAANARLRESQANADKVAKDLERFKQLITKDEVSRQQYDAAAQSFLDLSTKHGSHAKAPDALLRLAQSLNAMKQKEMACATLAEVGRKYPRASAGVKQGVEREQKRVHC